MQAPVILQIVSAFNHCLPVVCIPANVATIVILLRGKCDLAKGVSRYLVSMATADLLVIAFGIFLTSLCYTYFPFSFLFYTAVCSTNATLGYAAIDCSVWLTIAFTFDRFVAICCHQLKTRYCNEKTAAAVIALVCVASVLRNAPFYFKYRALGTLGGINWGCATRPDFFTLPGWLAFFWLHHLLNPLLPYVLILLLNALTVRHIVLASRARRALRSPVDGDQRGDPEMDKRRRSIVLLFAVSGSFILLWMTKIGVFLLMEIANKHSYPSYDHPVIIADQLGTMLFYLSSCSNTAVYALTQSKVREELKRAARYPLTLIAKIFA